MDIQILKNLAQEMHQPVVGKEYFALTLSMNSFGKIVWTFQTQFKGYKSTKPLIELREPCLMNPENTLKEWKSIGQRGLVVSNKKHYLLYLQFGGNALVETELALKKLPFLSIDYEHRPFATQSVQVEKDFPKEAFNRSPTKTMRMRVFKRDNYRCRICGRRPEDNVDITLHCHHIRPWANGGASIDDNLVTLCETCHTGLDPHHEIQLFELIGIELEIPKRSEYIDGVIRYREAARSLLTKARQERLRAVAAETGPDVLDDLENAP